ncbi:aminotransferase class V-fold PLP-dependent enzyme, partial [Xanthomonas citri]|uniref:aminotransferase class V-fold PLP-dependent enzyme n=1 Tax=Xanthomonas citri TaxID=346 RepID=UPI00062B8B34
MNVSAVPPSATPDWDRVRLEFPLLMRQVHGKPLIYFDNANTGQKPLQVIAATDEFYRRQNANVSRAVHAPGTQATDPSAGPPHN